MLLKAAALSRGSARGPLMLQVRLWVREEGDEAEEGEEEEAKRREAAEKLEDEQELVRLHLLSRPCLISVITRF